MKKLLCLSLLFISWSGFSQTVLPKTTTLAKMDSLPAGAYRIYIAPDSIDIYKDTPKIVVTTIIKTVHDTLRIHDTTINTIHDTTLRNVDSAAIMALKVCPVCPVCPPPIVCPAIPPQRIAISITIINGILTINYNDGTTSTLKNSILIQ
jgi:hypothetical protein